MYSSVLPPSCLCPISSTKQLYDPSGFTFIPQPCNGLGEKVPLFLKYTEPKWFLAVSVTPSMKCARNRARLMRYFDSVTVRGKNDGSIPGPAKWLEAVRSGLDAIRPSSA